MSTAAIPVHVALVDDTGNIDASDLAEVAGALNEQVQADFAPVWHVKATVGAYPTAPAGTWAIRLREQLDDPGALGYHVDEYRQPVAYVDISGGTGHGVGQHWSVTASHELLEMLADPWGNRLHGARHLTGWAGHGRVRYLLEVCDPCERFSYQVGGVEVSDFLLPSFYRSSSRGQHAPTSHLGSLTEPLEVADGGYISFVTADGTWWQRFVRNGQAQDRELGQASAEAGSLREFTDAAAREFRAQEQAAPTAS